MDIKRKYLITVGTASALTLALIAGGSALAAGRLMHKPTAVGIVSQVSGSTITLKTSGGTIYSIDASHATIKKITPPATAGAKPTPTPITVDQIQAGDTLVVQGTLSGTSVTATQITDGAMSGHFGPGMRQPGISGTISSITGNTITVSGTNSTTYSVDVSNAKINKFTPGANGTKGTSAAIAIGGLQTGDTVHVTGTVTGSDVVATQIMDGTLTGKGLKKGFTKPAAAGTVASVSSSTLTVTGKNNVVYSVDATNATVKKFTPGASGTKPTVATIALSQVQIGDNVTIQGTVSGTAVTATQITDGTFPAMPFGKARFNKASAQ